MYPKNSDEQPMFMYTWPDIYTFNSGVFLEDYLQLNSENSLHISSRIGWQRDGINNNSGYQSLQIFYPDMNRYTQRLLFKIATHYLYNHENWNFSIGGGYGERAPSISEAYGFYLFNSYENYDYIGNPNLKKEKSLEGDFFVNYTKKRLNISLETSYFYFFDYIIGKQNYDLSSMTIRATGVKVYTSLKNAFILNNSLQINYYLFDFLEWNNQISYHLGKDNNNNNLPFIAPITYKSQLSFTRNKINCNLIIKGAGAHNAYSKIYGESKTIDYLIYDINLSYSLSLNPYKIIIKGGIENIGDKKYTTYADWNSIPRKGRNYFINILFNI